MSKISASSSFNQQAFFAAKPFCCDTLLVALSATHCITDTLELVENTIKIKIEIL